MCATLWNASRRRSSQTNDEKQGDRMGERDMGVLLLSLLAKKEAGLELGELGLKATEDMGE